MWKKILFIIFIFFVFALLQNSFFTHFNLFGASPNLIFILFFLMVFFGKKNYPVIFVAITAGIFLDIFSYTYYIGSSIVLLVVIGLLLKKTQLLLKNREDEHPFVYFLPLFVIFLLIYELFLGIFGQLIIFSLIYNLIVASLGFLVFKKYAAKV